LDFPLVEGKIGGKMPPDWVVISERAARKYFGEVSAVGKTLVLRYPQRRFGLSCGWRDEEYAGTFFLAGGFAA